MKTEEEEIMLDVESIGLKGIKFSIDGNEKIITPESVANLKEHIESWISFYQNWSHYVNRYKDCSDESIEADLVLMDKQNAEYEDEEDSYEIGENFAMFLETTNKKGGYYCNNEASREIEKMLKASKLDVLDKLMFDPESGYCYIYTKDREVARTFLKWSYETIIKPKLDDIIS